MDVDTIMGDAPENCSRLLDLPTELITKIMFHLRFPVFLKNACLACKQLFDVATPFMYETVRMPAFEQPLKPFSNKALSFLHDNRHTRHIKVLIIDMRQMPTVPRDTTIFSPVFAMILSLLRPGTLEYLCIPSGLLDVQLFMLLCTTQPNLKRLTVEPSQNFHMVPTQILPKPEDIRSPLGLEHLSMHCNYTNSRLVYLLGAAFIARNPQVKILEIKLDRNSLRPNMPGILLAHTEWVRMLKFMPRFSRLTDLSLQGMLVYHSERGMFPITKMRLLKRLSLRRCQGTPQLLATTVRGPGPSQSHMVNQTLRI